MSERDCEVIELCEGLQELRKVLDELSEMKKKNKLTKAMGGTYYFHEYAYFSCKATIAKLKFALVEQTGSVRKKRIAK